MPESCSHFLNKMNTLSVQIWQFFHPFLRKKISEKVFLAEPLAWKLKSKWKQKTFKNLWFVVFFIKVVWFLGESHLSSRLQWNQISCVCVCQMCWSIKCYDQNTFVYITVLCCLSGTAIPCMCFPKDSSSFYLHIFAAAAPLSRWSYSEGLLSISILGYMQPFQNWEQHTGVPGTSGCLYCWSCCFGSWDSTCITVASGSSFRASQFLLQSKFCCLLSLLEYFY